MLLITFWRANLNCAALSQKRTEFIYSFKQTFKTARQSAYLHKKKVCTKPFSTATLGRGEYAIAFHTYYPTSFRTFRF